MKITSFNPLIVTNNSEAAVKLFEDLGFEVRHTKTGINDSDITDFRMRYESENGKVFHVDIAKAPVPKDITTIRMNIDDFDEAYKFFMDHGFREAKGFAPSTTASSKYAYLVSPTGFIVDVCQHIKN